MYEKLKSFINRPKPFEFYTAETLWNDEHISKQMLGYHLDNQTLFSSRKFDFIDRSVNWMIENFKLDSDKSVADFGCGPGLYASRLAKHGINVTGIDFSKRSIEYAKNFASENNLNIEYLNQNYLDFQSDKKFDLITLIYCDICVLSPEQSQQLLNIFKKHLKDDGRIFLDVSSLEVFKSRSEITQFENNLMGGFWSANDYFGFSKTFKYEEESLALDKYLIVEEDREFEIYNWFKCYSKETVTKLFEDNGLAVESFYSNVAGDEYKDDSTEIAVVAKLR